MGEKVDVQGIKLQGFQFPIKKTKSHPLTISIWSSMIKKNQQYILSLLEKYF